MNFLSIDIGTTACKCQLFSDKGEILAYRLEEYPFLSLDGYDYVNVDQIRAQLLSMIGSVSAEYKIDSVAISSLGESFVLLDKDDRILFYPMLYTDPRGEEEAGEISAALSDEAVFSVTGTVPHSMYSISKLLYIRKNAPKVFEKIDKVMLIGDYFGYLLTGERVIDYSLAARTGAFDVSKMEFSERILSRFGIDVRWFSSPKRAGSTVGRIRREYCEDAVLVLGSHDQICSSLGAGALSAGDAVDGMGTVECFTVLFEGKKSELFMGRQGYPCVPYAVDGLYCTYMLNYSCGSAVNLLRKNFFHGYKGEEESFFDYIEKRMGDAPSGLLCLPYFAGAATPHADLSARGAILGISKDTEDGELYRALLEGCAMEMRYNADALKAYGIEVKSAVATGGGANSRRWLSLKADVQGIPYQTLRSSEGGLCGLAMLQAVALSGAKDLFEAREIFVRYKEGFLPKMTDAYLPFYEKYKKIYITLKEIMK